MADTKTTEINSLQLNHLEKDEIIQIIPTHEWGGCLAVVDEVKNFGCQAFVTVPTSNGFGPAYIRLNWKDFEKVGAKAIFLPDGS